MWKPGTFVPVNLEDPNIQELVEAFSHGNNSTWVHCFSVTDQQVFRDGPDRSWTTLYGLHRENLNRYFTKLLTSPDIIRHLGELEIAEPLAEDLGFRQVSPLILDGAIAERLTWGGAYHQFKGSAAEAKRLGQRFSDYLSGERYEGIKVCRSDKDWIDDYPFAHWDTTWIIFDAPSAVVWVIYITDSD